MSLRTEKLRKRNKTNFIADDILNRVIPEVCYFCRLVLAWRVESDINCLLL